MLREYDVGSLVGKTFAEVAAKYGEEYRRNRDYVPFGGENSQMVCERA